MPYLDLYLSSEFFVIKYIFLCLFPNLMTLNIHNNLQEFEERIDISVGQVTVMHHSAEPRDTIKLTFETNSDIRS